MNGPFPAGTNDITVFRKNRGLKDELERRKQKAIGDRGYTRLVLEVRTNL
jgi:hypothetical protein